jgi:hypothetical protein
MTLIVRSSLAACALVALAALDISTLPMGCSGQGEGERCDHLADNAGTDDCAGDLVCTPASSLNGNDHNTDRCCPSDRRRATTFVCQLPTAGGIDAAPPPTDGATGVPSDAPSDAPPVDAPSDAPPSDAPSDAPTEDGGADAPADG